MFWRIPLIISKICRKATEYATIMFLDFLTSLFRKRGSFTEFANSSQAKLLIQHQYRPK